MPLFPLPVVLLPGAHMPLHIFEQRYQDMVRDCLRSDRRFGLIYHDWDRQGPFLSEPGQVGCVALIEEHQPLDDGRSLIVAAGQERFRIHDGLESESAYFEGLVTALHDDPAPPDLPARRAASISLFRAVLQTLPDDPEIPDEVTPAQDVSFLLARTIHVDPAWHQQLLEFTTERERLDMLDQVFRALLD